jgi:hypothetical protein
MQTKPPEGAWPTTGPFEAGPYRWLSDAVDPARTPRQPASRRALMIAGVCWIPLAILAALQGLLLSPRPYESFLLDFEAHARYLVAAPAFVMAASIYQPLLSNVVRQFLECRMITDADLPRYHALIESTRRVLASRGTDVIVLALAYISTLILGPMMYPPDRSTWVAPLSEGTTRQSLAGWWRMLVSQPLFVALLGAWLCRVMLWIRFLWTVSRMNLQLVASHPDNVGGLRFLLQPITGFAVLAFGIGAMMAGTLGDEVIKNGQLLRSYQYVIAAQVAVVLALFAGPLLLMMMPLLTLKMRGTNSYGRLASELGRQFEARWVGREHVSVEQGSLEAADFSTTTDLFAIVANVGHIRPVMLDLPFVLGLVIATLLPYLPLVFAIMPVDELVGVLMKTIT